MTKVNSLEGKVDRLMQIAYDSGKLGAAVTSLAITGLEGDTAKEGQLIAFFKNGYAGNGDFRLQLEGDTGNNYGKQLIKGQTTSATAARSTSSDHLTLGFAIAQNNLSFGVHDLFLESGKERTANSQVAYTVTGTTVTDILSLGQVWSNTADEVTAITPYATQADGIGADSRVVLLTKNNLTSGAKFNSLNVKGQVKGAWNKLAELEVSGGAITSC